MKEEEIPLVDLITRAGNIIEIWKNKDIEKVEMKINLEEMELIFNAFS